MQITRTAKVSAWFAAALAVSTLAGASVGRLVSDRHRADAAPGPIDPSLYTDIDYEAATARIDALATPRFVEMLRSQFRTADSAIVVMVTAADCLTCEDLGRQLRELRQATVLPLVVTSDSSATEIVAAFLARERMGAVRVIPVSRSLVLTGGRQIATPAAIIVDLLTGRAFGVSHTRRFKFTRVQSFRDELGLVQAEEGEASSPSTFSERREP